ncbi:hypothetical protein CSV71_03180 [Sporosarcina sp. P21c]|uniref:hypothetical protein n=2 Tax=Sporosarcina TaxID=1569 RepID=UPI000C167407|nr:hypothetical protein [Sporosarcina sp. P21c]PIC67729.1 hypothetical protein CSV78_05270 [Sporosarcina sp. P16a]PIC90588.1 hypothetical protein CSV71_03180 [Sporosarcina sp. P21c]PIC93354.1 hypothetical protein CSV70_05135 [Sporosarcina sp. P25]
MNIRDCGTVFRNFTGYRVCVSLSYGKPIEGVLIGSHQEYILMVVDESILYILVPSITSITKNTKDLSSTKYDQDYDVPSLFELREQWVTLNEFSKRPMYGVLSEIEKSYFLLINKEELQLIPVTSIETIRKGSNRIEQTVDSKPKQVKKEQPVAVEVVSNEKDTEAKKIIKEAIVLSNESIENIHKPVSTFDQSLDLKVVDTNEQEEIYKQDEILIEDSERLPIKEIRILNNTSFRDLMAKANSDLEQTMTSIESEENIELFKMITPLDHHIGNEKFLTCIDCLQDSHVRNSLDVPMDFIPQQEIENLEIINHTEMQMSSEEQMAMLEKQYYALMKHAAKNSCSSNFHYENDSIETVITEGQYTALLKHAADMHRTIISK